MPHEFAGGRAPCAHLSNVLQALTFGSPMQANFIARIALLAGALASAAGPLCALQGSGGSCPASLTGDPYPRRVTSNVLIGLGGTGYSATGLATPELIPLGVEAADSDVYLATCDTACKAVTSSSDYDVDWTASIGQFVDASANATPTLNGYWHVLYLPPNNLAVGATQTATITATARDVCGLATDPPSVITIRVVVSRNTDDPDLPGTPRFNVSANLVSIVDPTIPPPFCPPGTSQLCEIVGFYRLVGPTPSGQITSAPPGMVVGETRPLDSDVSDMDRIVYECGTPPGHQPPSHTLVDQLICDSIRQYQWSVVAGPGNGVFVRAGRTALFRATQAGPITVRLIARTADGESVTDTETFTIHDPKLKGVEFANNENVDRDFDGALYDGYDWYDHDGDGLAATADPSRSNGANLAGDRRFPLAFVRGTATAPRRVGFRKVAINTNVRPMPGATLIGEIAGLPAQQFKGGWQPATPASQLVAENMTGRQLIPDIVGRVPSLAVRWDVTWDSSNVVPTGSTDNTYYLVRATPALPGGLSGVYAYKAFESFFDISCRSQSGSSAELDVVAGTWAALSQFSPPGGSGVPRTARKAIDGHLNPDGQVMNYWGGSTPGACQSVSQMLAHPNGDGACGSWAQLLRGCLGVHGVSASGFLVQAPPVDDLLMVNNWREVNVQNADDPWTIGVDVSQNDASGMPVPGIAGQDNLSPVKHFNLHHIVKYGADYYDPSYGVGPFASEAAYEDAAFWGFMWSLGTVSQGFRNNPGVEATFTPFNL